MDEDEPRKMDDPRGRLLADLTPNQRYLLYAALTIGVILVIFLELSSR